MNDGTIIQQNKRGMDSWEWILKNGIQDEEDLIIMEEVENNHQTNASATVAVIVVVIVAIMFCP